MDAGIADRNLRIEIFAMCESASDQNGRLSILGTFDSITGVQFPLILQQAAVVLRLRFWPLERRNHSVRLTTTDPDGREVMAPVEAAAALLPSPEDQSSAYNIIFHVRDLCLNSPGEHTVDFYLDGGLEGRLPFTVVQAPPRDAGAQ